MAKLFRSKKNNKDAEMRRPAAVLREHSVFSYYGNRQPVDPSAQRREREPAYRQTPVKKGFAWHKLPAYLAVLVIFISVVYVFSVNGKPQVLLTALDNKSSYRPTDAYEEAGARLLQKSIWSKDKLTINSKALETTLKTQYPELESVTVAIPLMSHRPVIGLTLVEPLAIFTTPQASVVLGQNGHALMSVNEASKASLAGLPVIHEQLNRDIKTGNAVLTSQDVSFINTTIANLRSRGREVSTLTMPTVASELQLTLKDKPYYIKMNTMGDPLVQIGALYATEAKLAGESKQPSEYIDVRLGERAYVK